MRTELALAIVLGIGGVDGALAQTKFTPATGPTCKDESTEELSLWTCPGPAGYVISFADEGNIVSLTIAPRREIEKVSGPTAQWRGAGKSFGEKVQWIMRAGVPRAAVIRTWRTVDEDEKKLQELSVFAINGANACLVDSVDIHADRANDVALARAQRAASEGCPRK
ncbi:hypothetical protein [Bradyrhizobium sp. CCBAU 11357]|uniref:hypothetical protein n=1 Tax=Bradyrhizobium sp. CCBAU 11357 TaxID=1630808 RepID=UPI00230371A0|nr:hypothetical protein [Bradyrhizobium sp. CCBAU 11357]MDA9495970.1 hypothetical protein [Bradyrhizobium sp. CCBAU 11357]